MKRLFILAALGCSCSPAWSNEPLLVPRGEYAYVQPGTPAIQPLPEPRLGVPTGSPGSTFVVTPEVGPTPIAETPQSPLPPVMGKVVSLYPHVKVKSAHLSYPGGVPEVVEVPNPTPRSGCCEPVYVQICVPPGCPPRVSYGPLGQRVTYAFGGYRVKVTSLRGVVTVDYDRLW